MAVTKPIPVRLGAGVIARLDAAAARMGTNRSATIKFLLQTFLDSFERCGIASLPHDWRTVMHKLDGRTYGQQQFQSQSLRVAEAASDAHAAPLPKVRSVKYAKKKSRP